MLSVQQNSSINKIILEKGIAMANILNKLKQNWGVITSVLLIVITNLILNIQYVIHINVVDDLTYCVMYNEMSPMEFICNLKVG